MICKNCGSDNYYWVNKCQRCNYDFSTSENIIDTKQEDTVEISFDSIKIGDQLWMSKNLNLTTFRNGDLITEAKTNIEWENAGEERKPAWCYYNNEPSNGEKYGKLYNWNTLKDSRGLAPKGWHVPTYREFDELIVNSGVSGKEVYKQLIVGGKSGFNSVFCGWRDEKGEFHDLEKNTGYHCLDEMSALNIRGDWQLVRQAGFPFPGIGFAVRCLKD